MSKSPEKERGTILLTTLLIMAVMAGVSVAIMDDIRFAVKRVINVGDYAQADWYVKGAEDFASSYISDRLGRLPNEAKNQALLTPQIFAFPYEGGSMTLNVRDGTHCFSLGSLVTVASVMELRSLQGMTEELYQSIRPFVCARGLGELTEFNINTATPLDAFVLSSLMGGAGRDRAGADYI